MFGASLSIDDREQRLIAAEREIARLREVQMRDLAELDTAQVSTGDGSRSLSEWTAARLDVGPETAKTLVRSMRRLLDRPDLMAELAAGRVSFDRIEAVSRISEDVGLLEWADVAQVRREAAKRARVSAEDEYRAADDRYLAMQPSLDQSRWRIWGELDGHSGLVVDKVLTGAADALPDLPDAHRGSQGWRRATALVECLVSDHPPPTQVTVIVDARDAAPTAGEAAVVLDSGARVGRRALQTILCDADTEVVARTSEGRFMDYGRRQRSASPALKRTLLSKTGSAVLPTAAIHVTGSKSTMSSPGARAEPPTGTISWFSAGSTTTSFIHQPGYEIYTHHPQHRRIRFRKPDRAPPRWPGKRRAFRGQIHRQDLAITSKPISV